MAEARILSAALGGVSRAMAAWPKPQPWRRHPRTVVCYPQGMLRRLLRVAVVAGLVVAGPIVPAQAQTDIASLGPQVGQRSIEFNLPDQNGRVRTLKSLAGPKGTMLVFFRSADW